MNTGIPGSNHRIPGVDVTSASLNTAGTNTKTPSAAPRQAPAAADTPNLTNPLAPTADQRTDTGAASAKPDRKTIEEMLTRIAEQIETVQRGLRFQVDDELGEVIIRVIDRSNDQVIRQIPSEELVTLDRRIREVSRLLFDDIKA